MVPELSDWKTKPLLSHRFCESEIGGSLAGCLWLKLSWGCCQVGTWGCGLTGKLSWEEGDLLPWCLSGLRFPPHQPLDRADSQHHSGRLSPGWTILERASTFSDVTSHYVCLVLSTRGESTCPSCPHSGKEDHTRTWIPIGEVHRMSTWQGHVGSLNKIWNLGDKPS